MLLIGRISIQGAIVPRYIVSAECIKLTPRVEESWQKTLKIGLPPQSH